MASNLIAMAGPNGAGKSTSGPKLIRDILGIREYVDADLIARKISPRDPGGAAWEAGRAMIRRLRDLVRRRKTFAFETTLASRSFAPWIRDLLRQGWRFRLIFFWLPGAD